MAGVRITKYFTSLFSAIKSYLYPQPKPYNGIHPKIIVDNILKMAT
jgi:hypothetical protein